MATADEILEYWFGPLDSLGLPKTGREQFWFGHDTSTDSQIRARYSRDVERAARDDFGQWRESPRGRLALILLLDQFPRNIHRGTPAAFAHDDLALELVREGLLLEQERALTPIERAFFYLPLEHAEDLASQEESVRAFTRLVHEAPSAVAERLHVFLDYAVRHRDIIERFGRFPHRNQVLGRASTPAELAFLATAGSSF